MQRPPLLHYYSSAVLHPLHTVHTAALHALDVARNQATYSRKLPVSRHREWRTCNTCEYFTRFVCTIAKCEITIIQLVNFFDLTMFLATRACAVSPLDFYNCLNRSSSLILWYWLIVFCRVHKRVSTPVFNSCNPCHRQSRENFHKRKYT